jgi:hypothetical protein
MSKENTEGKAGEGWLEEAMKTFDLLEVISKLRNSLLEIAWWIGLILVSFALVAIFACVV